MIILPIYRPGLFHKPWHKDPVINQPGFPMESKGPRVFWAVAHLGSRCCQGSRLWGPRLDDLEGIGCWCDGVGLRSKTTQRSKRDAWQHEKLGCAYRDEQMRNWWPFSLLNDEQMSNWLGVEHQPEKQQGHFGHYIIIYLYNYTHMSSDQFTRGLFVICCFFFRDVFFGLFTISKLGCKPTRWAQSHQL